MCPASRMAATTCRWTAARHKRFLRRRSNASCGRHECRHYEPPQAAASSCAIRHQRITLCGFSPIVWLSLIFSSARHPSVI